MRSAVRPLITRMPRRLKEQLSTDLLSDRVSEYRLAEKPALDALTTMGYATLHSEAAMTMRQEANRVLLKPALV